MVINSNTLTLARINDGEQGIPGNSSYIWIKYTTNEDITHLTSADLTDSSEGALYIGIAYNQTQQTESTNPSDYNWTKFKGDDGDGGFSVIVDNENFTFMTDETNMPVQAQTFDCKVTVWKGIERLAYTDYEIVEEDIVVPRGLSVTIDELTWTVSVSCDPETKIASNSGNIEIPISIFGTYDTSKILTYTLNRSNDLDSVTYTWVKYSEYARPDANEMYDETSAKMKYIGVAYEKTSPDATTDYRDYEWLKMPVMGSYEIEIEELYYKSPYNVLSNIPLPDLSAEIALLDSDIISVSEGAIMFGKNNWSETKPKYEKGYYLWTCLKVTLDDGSVLYTTPLLYDDWGSDDIIGGTQLIRNSKTLIDTRIYWF